MIAVRQQQQVQQMPLMQNEKLSFVKSYPMITEESLEFRTKKKSNISKVTSLEKSKETSIQLEVNPSQEIEKGKRYDISYFSNELMTVIQNGNRTKTIEQTSDATENSKFVKDIPKGTKVQKGNEISTEVLNDEKMTFRSGYQAQGSENQSAEYDRLLKDTSKKIVLEKMEGSLNGANCHNGYSRPLMFF